MSQQTELEARWAADPDPVFRRARELVAASIPGLTWYDTEAVARQVARTAAERELTVHAELVQALQGLHNAMDLTMAELIMAKPGYLPTQSAAWPAVVASFGILKKVRPS